MAGKINKFWLAVMIVLIALALGLCVFAVSRGSIYIRPEGEPQETVTRFFDSLEAERYEDAYACLSDYKTLGLENEPGSDAGKQVFTALKASYEYTLLGPCTVDQLTATQKLSFRYLDVKSMEASITEKVDGILETLVAERPRNEIYDENDGYLPAVTDEVYATALAQTLEDAESFYTTTELEIQLDYLNDQWLMKTSPALINAIQGGAA